MASGYRYTEVAASAAPTIALPTIEVGSTRRAGASCRDASSLTTSATYATCAPRMERSRRVSAILVSVGAASTSSRRSKHQAWTCHTHLLRARSSTRPCPQLPAPDAPSRSFTRRSEPASKPDEHAAAGPQLSTCRAGTIQRRAPYAAPPRPINACWRHLSAPPSAPRPGPTDPEARLSAGTILRHPRHPPSGPHQPTESSHLQPSRHGAAPDLRNELPNGHIVGMFHVEHQLVRWAYGRFGALQCPVCLIALQN